MNLFNLIRAKFISDKDMHILKLQEELKVLKKQNKELKKELILVNNNKRIPIRFYDENIEKVIIENLQKAENEVCIAMAWFTSPELMEELERLKERGVKIKIIISNARYNEKWIYKLGNSCDTLRKAIIPSLYNNIMHNKYCIIDKEKVIDGSYNWTRHARKNLEHIIIIEDFSIANKYRDSFYKIFNNSKYYANYTTYDMVN